MWFNKNVQYSSLVSESPTLRHTISCHKWLNPNGSLLERSVLEHASNNILLQREH